MAKLNETEKEDVHEIDLTRPRKLVIYPARNNRPRFDFHGQWAARDIQTVVRHIVKAFRQYQQDVRRNMAAQAVSQQTQEQLASTKGV